MTSPKRGYHHGDLRNALVEAAAQLAEEGGPKSVTVRAAARAAGVTPTAAYRHFENHDELLKETKHRAMERMEAAMQEYVRALPATDDPVLRAFGWLGAVGRGYIHFATTEPGLFRTAFEQGGSILDGEALTKSDAPFRMLVKGLDDLVAVGHLSPEFRPMAEITAWSAVHGFSMLVIDGPLADWPAHMRAAAVNRMFGLLARSLTDGEVSEELAAAMIEGLPEGEARPTIA
jgi:AcrR family transcriptional regulator